MTQFDLVFEGGGAKGIVFGGALRAFEALGHTHGRVIGTSAGAITATLLAAGYTAAEIQDVLAETDPATGQPVFATFMDTPPPFGEDAIRSSLSFEVLRNIDIPLVSEKKEERFEIDLIEFQMKFAAYRKAFSLIEFGGLYAGDAFLNWFKAKLNAKGDGLADATLAEFAERTGSHLTVVASDISGSEMLVLNHRTAPKCPVAMAVRMSMSIPFVWQSITWQAKWGTYTETDELNITGHDIVDGGVLSNFPLHLLTSDDAAVEAVMGPPQDTPVLGMLIDETLPVPNAPPAEASTPPNRKGVSTGKGQHTSGSHRLIKRIGELVNTMTRANDTIVIEAHQPLVARLPAKGYGTTEFDMSVARMKALIDAGDAALRAYFKTRKV